MPRTGRLVIWGVCLTLPLLALGLWTASGREVLTQSGKNIEVAVRDEIFGDTGTEIRFVRGPILGYHVGLDLVLVVAFLAVLAAGVEWLWHRRRTTARPRGAAWGQQS